LVITLPLWNVIGDVGWACAMPAGVASASAQAAARAPRSVEARSID
jgi:hypothetical protein